MNTVLHNFMAGTNASPTCNVGSHPKKAVASKANLSGQYVQQLSTLQQLRENSVLRVFRAKAPPFV